MSEPDVMIPLRINQVLVIELDKLAELHKRSRNSEMLIALEDYVGRNKGRK